MRLSELLGDDLREIELTKLDQGADEGLLQDMAKDKRVMITFLEDSLPQWIDKVGDYTDSAIMQNIEDVDVCAFYYSVSRKALYGHIKVHYHTDIPSDKQAYDWVQYYRFDIQDDEQIHCKPYHLILHDKKTCEPGVDKKDHPEDISLKAIWEK